MLDHAADALERLCRAVGMFEHRHLPAAVARLDGAHKPGGAYADDDRVDVFEHRLERSKVVRFWA